MDKLTNTIEQEVQDTENFNKVVEICKKIPGIQKQTKENEKQANLLQVKLEQLKKECASLDIESALQKNQVEFLEDGVEKQIQLLHNEKEQLDNIQQGVWKEMREFINEVNSRTTSDGCEEAKKFLDKRAKMKAARELKRENMKLEGEVYALDLFKKLQEKQLKEIKDQIEMMKFQIEKSESVN